MFTDGTPEELDKDGYKSRLRQAFQGPFDYPLVLLVYNKAMTFSVLRAAGVDVSDWKNGLRTLLRQHENNKAESDQETMYTNGNLKRSRSPENHFDRDARRRLYSPERSNQHHRNGNGAPYPGFHAQQTPFTDSKGVKTTVTST